MRGGINKAVVRAARDRLRALDIYPSVKAVRDHIGSGSATTVHRYLKELESEEGDDVWGEMGRVSRTLAETVMELYSQLKGINENELAAARAELDKARERLISERDALAGKLAATEKDLKAAQDEGQLVRSMYDAEHQAHGEARLEIRTLSERLAQVMRQNEELHDRLRRAEDDASQARHQRDHFEERSKAEMDALRQTHDAAQLASRNEVQELSKRKSDDASLISELRMQLSTAESTANSSTIQLTDTRAELAQVRMANTVLTGQGADKDKQIAEQGASLKTAHEREREDRRMLAAANESLAETRQALAIANNNLEHSRREMEGLRKQLADAQARLHELEMA